MNIRLQFVKAAWNFVLHTRGDVRKFSVGYIFYFIFQKRCFKEI